MTVHFRYVAEFQAEAWVNDYAMPIDEPTAEWDVTDLLVNAPAGSYLSKLKRAADESEWTIDNDDYLRDTAPTECQQHCGPFTITVTKDPLFHLLGADD